MPRKRKLPAGEWVCTTAAAQALGISAWKLLQLRPEMPRRGHYLIVSARAARRPSYRWNVEAIQEWLQQGLEVR